MDEPEELEVTVDYEGQPTASVVVPAGESVIHMSIRFKDGIRTNLLLFELQTLIDEMRVMASPHADRLESALNRWLYGGDDDQDSDSDDPREPTEPPVLGLAK